MRRLADKQGTVIIIEPKVGDSLADDLHDGNDVERFIYAASVLHCLPVGMAEQPSAATGMAMRPATLRGYAREAGFRDIEILPIDDLMLRLYRLIA